MEKTNWDLCEEIKLMLVGFNVDIIDEINKFINTIKHFKKSKGYEPINNIIRENLLDIHNKLKTNPECFTNSEILLEIQKLNRIKF